MRNTRLNFFKHRWISSLDFRSEKLVKILQDQWFEIFSSFNLVSFIASEFLDENFLTASSGEIVKKGSVTVTML
jgi:hypothetical protein